MKSLVALALCCAPVLLPISAVASTQTVDQSALVARNTSAEAALPDAPGAAPPATTDTKGQSSLSLLTLPRAILEDQVPVWTSPARLRTHDLRWFVPLAAATGAAIATDHHTLGSVVSHDLGFNQANVNASNVLIGGFIAAPAALFAYGHLRGSEQQRIAGLHGAEALVDGVIVEQGLKLIFWRERPAQDNARGLFFQGRAGADGSFPSSHSVLAWSSAAVLADDIHSPWGKLAVYSLASGVSLTRVLGAEHFPSDVVVGSAAGWLLGHYVVHRHAHRAH